MTIIKRVDLGRPLTWEELDSNFEQVDQLVNGAQVAVQTATTQAQAASQFAASASQSSQNAQTAANNAGSAATAAVQVVYTDLASTNVNKGASLVNLRNGRSVETRFKDYVSVKDFGAKGDGSTDDTASIQAAVDSLSPLGGRINFPPGRYVITNVISAANMPLEIAGAGLMSTIIEQHAAGKSGLIFTSNTTGNAPTTDNLLINTLHIHDISINKAASGGGIALDASWKLMTSNSKQLILERFRTYSVSDAGFTWAGAVRLTNCNGLRVSKTQLHGNPLESSSTTADPYTMKYGIQFNNSDDSLGLISFFIDSLTVMCASRGIQVYGWHEGFEIVNSELVQVHTGCEIFGNSAHQNPDFFYLNSHIEARSMCINASNVFKVKLSNCDLFKNSNDVVSGSIVSLNNCIAFSATGTTFSTNDASDSIGITTDNNSYHGNVSGCHFLGFTTANSKGMNLLGGNWLIDGNVFYNCYSGIQLYGSGNQVGTNKYTQCTNWLQDFTTGNLKQPREYLTDYTWAAVNGTDQAFTVPVPTGIFKGVPEYGFVTPVSSSGPLMMVTYDRAGSTITSARFVIKATTSITSGNYTLGVSLKSLN